VDYATINRQRKAIDMVAALDRNAVKQGISPFDQAGRILAASLGWTDDEWHRIAKNAGYTSKKTPGPETRSLVRDVYRSRAQAPVQKVAS
jgi:hypothetical protein